MVKRDVEFVRPIAGCRSAEKALGNCLAVLLMLRQGIRDNREMDEKAGAIHAVRVLRLLEDKAEEAYRSIVGLEETKHGQMDS